jgi:transposase
VPNSGIRLFVQRIRCAHALCTTTNNIAERSLRHAVIRRKGSFGTWSADGSAFVSRILTVVTTLRQQGRHALDYVTDACTAALHDQRPGSLLPHPASSRA